MMLSTIMERFSGPRSTAAARRRQGWLRLALALVVMLGTVLPHATLSAMPAAPAGATHAEAEPASPCHGEAQAPAHSREGPVASACCGLGCALLAIPSGLAPTQVPAFWTRLSGSQDPAAAETVPEPGERPPRSLA